MPRVAFFWKGIDMNCPACGNVLTLMTAGGVTVDACERGCGGPWFDQMEIKKFDEPHESDGGKLLEVSRNPDIEVDLSQKRTCPKCGDVVMMQHFFSVKKKVTLDECPQCAGVWLDAGELAEIRSLFSSEEERRQAVWLFDLGHVPPRAEEFPPQAVSDGLLRAAAIALLSSMPTPPALLMIEEIENGISQRNLGRFWSWPQQAAGLPDSTDRGYNTQFLLTSHSPSILLEISKHLDDVFYMRLERRGYKSVVRNLNSALLGFVDLGTVEGEVEKRDGNDVVILSPQDIMNLWYSGVIGAEPANEHKR